MFEALFYLTTIFFELKIRSFNVLARRYALHTSLEESCVSTDADMMRSIGWAVERVSRLLPVDGLCLVKALSAQRMLVKRKLKGVIYMGVKRSDEQQMEAHAWLCCNCAKNFLTGRSGHRQFTVVTKFTWDVDS